MSHASKAALLSLTRTMALEWGGLGLPSYLDDAGLPVFVREEDLRRRLLDR